MTDRDAAAEFLDFLHADHEGWLCLAFDEPPWWQEFGRWPDEKERLIDLAMEQAPKADVYVGMLLYSARKRRQETALRGHVLWVDVDHAFTDEQEALIRKSDRFRVVESGTPDHSHLYMVQDGLMPAAELAQCNRKMAQRFNGEAWAAQTVLRLPGTFNHKNGEMRPVGRISVCR